MIGVALPISIGGWGLGELAATSLLGDYGVAPEANAGIPGWAADQIILPAEEFMS
jgi:hypothetical protein